MLMRSWSGGELLAIGIINYKKLFHPKTKFLSKVSEYYFGQISYNSAKKSQYCLIRNI